MNTGRLLDELHYSDSPNFLRSDKFKSFGAASDFSHIFRRASQHCRLQGVYVLRQSGNHERDTVVPVVYVCKAKNEAEAQRFHQIVWNQNVVPFIIIVSPRAVRLYSGFRYERPADGVESVSSGVLGAANEMEAALKILEAFRAEHIDDGTLWEHWGDEVTPQTRVNWKLLSALNALDDWLQTNGLDAPVSHALIGKYVYLSYLRDREILSDRKLAKWGIQKKQIFSRNATVTAFTRVVHELDEWLNGSMFPLPTSGALRPKQEHIRKVAGAFSGDDPGGQLSFDFDVYDFSFIPIETLSVVYEQFLHTPLSGQESSKGRSQGAYYTPIPLVNFMLEELDALHPFQHRMRVLDPACGSGAFLVQCYRRIIERDEEFRPNKRMRPARLRDLLKQHIFGIDRDGDACRVAELSLSLTLLDYVDPPDLEATPSFQLPDLHGSNISQGDFFDPNGNWRDTLSGMHFDWIVGNPPWIELKSGQIAPEDRHVWNWMQDKANREQFPTGGNQVAEAFSWEVTRYLAKDGVIALLLPAMTLFKNESRQCRQRFFSTLNVQVVANFANLADVLFPGRATTSRPRRAAAAFFYSIRYQSDHVDPISVFSPLVADQHANRPPQPGKTKDIWNIVINASQIHSLELDQVSDGSALPWKTAMWGSHLDIRLLNTMASRCEKLETFCARNNLSVSEGFQLRSASSREAIDPMPELAGNLRLKIQPLKNCGRIFEFPSSALETIPREKCFVRRGRGERPRRVSEPPHVIVDRLRRFSVYSDEFIAVPPRQIGISGKKSQSDLLKALSLYLVSDFAIYHQFFVSPEWGISTSSSTLNALKALPVPFAAMTDRQLAAWVELHGDIVTAARATPDQDQPSLFGHSHKNNGNLWSLMQQLNDQVSNLLQLRDYERILVTDLVHLRMQLIKGKVTRDAVRPATEKELACYAGILRDELDAFVEDQPGLKHSVVVVYNESSTMLAVELKEGVQQSIVPRILRADSQTAEKFKAIRKQIRKQNNQWNDQWIYFERNLRIYQGASIYVFKPQQRLYWTQSQAILDVGSIIAETLSSADEA